MAGAKEYFVFSVLQDGKEVEYRTKKIDSKGNNITEEEARLFLMKLLMKQYTKIKILKCNTGFFIWY